MCQELLAQHTAFEDAFAHFVERPYVCVAVSQYWGITQNVDHWHIIAHSWAWYAVGVGIRERRRKMYEESGCKKCLLKDTGCIPWNESKYNAIKGTTAMERFGDPKKVEDDEITYGSDIAVLKEMFDLLRKMEMKVGDIWHRRERRETYHCQVDEILSKLDEFIYVHGDAKKRSTEYWHRPLSLEGVHDYALLLPPEQCKRQTALENLMYKKRFDSDNEYNSDEHDGRASGSEDGSGEAVLVSADANMSCLCEHQRNTRREEREPHVRRHSQTPARGGSPAYSRDKAPSC